MKYCEYCGAPLDVDALFCTSCGARLSPIQPAPPQVVKTFNDTVQTKPALQQDTNDIEERKSNNRTIIFALIGGVLIVGALIAILMLTNTKEKSFSDIDDMEEEVVQQRKFSLHGTVDIYPVYMKLSIEGNVVNGSYYYESQGPGKQLNLRGIYDDGRLELFETDENGQQTGHFVGQLKKGIYIGIFYNARGNSMQFRLDK